MEDIFGSFLTQVSRRPVMQSSEHFGVVRHLRDLEARIWKLLLAPPLCSLVAEVFGRKRVTPSSSVRRLLADDPSREKMEKVIRMAVARRKNKRWRTQLDKLLSQRKALTDDFVERNLRLVLKIVSKYRRFLTSETIIDAVQEGTIGMMRAMNLFNPDLGNSFSTYATWWIRQTISRWLSDHYRTVRIPVHALDARSRVSRSRAALRNELDREPTDEEVIKHARVRPGLYHVICGLQDVAISLDSAEEGEKGLDERLADPEAEDPSEVVADRKLAKIIQREVRALPPNYRQVLTLRFGLEGDEPLCLREVGDVRGVTRERIRQLQNDALKLLQQRLHLAGVDGVLPVEYEGRYPLHSVPKLEIKKGYRFGKFTVLEHLDEEGWWRCQCECGEEAAFSAQLIEARARMACDRCSAQSRSRAILFSVGQRVGNATVRQVYVPDHGSTYRYRLLCMDCGKESMSSSRYLNRGIGCRKCSGGSRLAVA